ncbi:MAG: protein-L-isoaspartate(D-aspartate) O-methyltransferase [Alphaproteobacteria bacterium]|nr:protein-L-isoaspartate(D-aspartate) O-methyltransferase [Alphaproteobacteria bacterium]
MRSHPVRRAGIETRWLALAVAALVLATPHGTAASDEFAAPRAAMVRLIEQLGWGSKKPVGHENIDPRVLAVMGKVPRHEFVPEDLRDAAYANRPLPIGYGQTISQPLIVAMMTDLLQLEPDHVVLEVGTGSGYHAAVVAGLARRVYTIEIVPALAEMSARRLRRMGYDNVEVRAGDGYYGWQSAAPFDRILVTAAAGHVPPPLIEQLRPGGRMVIPVGGAFLLQHLVLVEKDAAGSIRTRQLLPVSFVPLTRAK